MPIDNFRLYAEDEKLNGSDIKVTVDSPQRHVETFETYVSYKVTVQVRDSQIRPHCRRFQFQI